MQSVFEIIEITGGQLARAGRPGQPIRRNTKTHRGEEAGFWRPFSPRNRARLLLAAERYDTASRLQARASRTGRKIGHLGHVALDVLRDLLRLVDYRTGRLDPALTTIARRTGHSVAGVVAAIKRLKAHGFLDWLRRYESTGNTGRAPQVRQISNAYRLTIPARALALLPGEAPAPDDLDHERAERDNQRDNWAFDDSPLGGVFARWGAAILEKERDSKQQRESRPTFNYKGASA